MLQTSKLQAGTAAHTLLNGIFLNAGAPIPGLQNFKFLVKTQRAPIRPLLFYTQIQKTRSFKMTNAHTEMTL